MLISTLPRREFLKAAGSLIVTFSFAGLLPRAASAADAAKTVALDQVDGFLSIGADGAVTVYSGKVDLGQGLLECIEEMRKQSPNEEAFDQLTA